MFKSVPSKSAVLSYPLLNLILFKLSWVVLVAGQEAFLLLAVLLQLGSLWLHPHLATAWRPALLVAATGMAVDQLLVLSGVFVFASPVLPLWLIMLWLAFGLTLTFGLRFLQALPLWAQSCIGALCGTGSYQAGVYLDAVSFGKTAGLTLLLLALLWAILLPVLLRMSRLNNLQVPRALLVLLLTLSVGSLPKQSLAQDSALQLVGHSTYRVMFWHLYDARLYANSINFSFPESVPFQLSLEYKRAFKKQQILGETLKQWQQQGLTIPAHWKEQMEILLPDVAAGDQISLYVDSDYRAVMTNNGSVIGQINDRDLSIAFAGIWLAENTTHPEFRERLLGAKR